MLRSPARSNVLQPILYFSENPHFSRSQLLPVSLYHQFEQGDKLVEDMWFKIGFRFLADKQKFDMLREKGIMLGSRWRNERRVYLYMVKDFFVEVMYLKDDIDMEPEKISTFSNLDNLNAYLERDFRTAF